MPQLPQIAVCVTTYERPGNLALVLESIACQRGVDGKLEVVVTDDGSTDHTTQVVEEFARRVNFPVRFVTHSHDSFQAGRCRNAAVAASSAPYLLFLDGDCMVPPHHVATHLAKRRAGFALSSDACRLNEVISANITLQTVRAGDFPSLLTLAERRRLRKIDLRSRLYNFIRHPTKPRSLRSGDFSISRDDFQRINGFDENFRGWGSEDDDLGWRLRRAGIRLHSILRWTCSFHIWHPPGPTVPENRKKTKNAAYMRRRGKLVCCRNGLVKRTFNDMSVHIVGHTSRPDMAERLIAGRVTPRGAETKPEVELLFLPGDGNFTGRADCNVLVALDVTDDVKRMAPQAHLIVAPETVAEAPDVLQFPLTDWERALDAVA